VVKYSLEIKQSAQKEMDQLDEKLFTQIDRKLLALAENPRPAGCKKLKGYKDQWRIRAGDWRVLYIIDDMAKLVAVTRIAYRRDVYK
jgi:mRNA interferase RelE/StbE